MKYNLLILLILFQFQGFGQEYQQDILYEVREKYSSNKKFNEYCKYMYTKCKENGPLLSIRNPELKKYFKIPATQRLKLYPFNEYDSIVVVIDPIKKIITLDNVGKNKLSNIMFNYSYDVNSGFAYEGYENDGTKYKIMFFNTKEKKDKYIEWYYGGDEFTNFTTFELSQIDLNMEKMEQFCASFLKN